MCVQDTFQLLERALNLGCHLRPNSPTKVDEHLALSYIQ